MNNEDFNGTVFGSFQCPLPGFENQARYCCGNDNEEYCCKYFDEYFIYFKIKVSNQ